jgi:transcriptional regulator with XRE-family HTH domain
MRNDTKRRAELADFLKTRRARLRPEQFGLPGVGRRRTPGLRRDEVAHLAGVGVSWYTWLEQGRDITVSNQVLESLAEALQLTREERRHLFLLARGMVPVADESTFATPLPEGLQAVLNALGTAPAILIDERFNLVAWNESACRVFGDFTLLSEKERNRIWYLFINPAARQLFVHWEQATHHAVMHLRSVYAVYAGDLWFEQFLLDLQQASPEFHRLWSQHDVQESCDLHHEKELNHPQVGRLLFSSTILIVSGVSSLKIVVYAPSSPETRMKLEILGKTSHVYVKTGQVQLS